MLSFQYILLTVFHCPIGTELKKGHNSETTSLMEKKKKKKKKKIPVHFFSIPISDIKFQAVHDTSSKDSWSTGHFVDRC